jgi:hypothetical protein
MCSRKKLGRSRTGGRVVARLMLLLSVLIASVAVVPTAAHADFTTIWRNYRTGRCLDSNDAGHVYTLGCNGGNYQNWRVEYFTSLDCEPAYGECYPIYRIRNAQTRRCLDSDFNRSLYTSPCQDPNLWQKWEVDAWTDGQNRQVIQIKDVRTSWCLDANVPEGRPYASGNCYRGWPGYQDWKAGF